MAEETPAVPAVDAPPPAPPAVPWYASLDAEHQGHLQNKGWDKLDPAAAALELTKAWKGAEKLIGVPRDELLRKPKPGDAEAEKAFWNQLGAKDKAEEYDFSNLKYKDGKPLDEKFVGVVRTAAHELHLPADRANSFVQRVMGHMDAEAADATAKATAIKTLEVEKLNASWGAQKDMNTFVAQQAVTKLGIEPEAVTALESSVGYAKVMEMFRQLGSAMGESRFVENEGGGGGTAPVTYEMAVAQKAELMRDHVFVKAWINNGPQSPERVKMAQLDALIAANPNHLRR